MGANVCLNHREAYEDEYQSSIQLVIKKSLVISVRSIIMDSVVYFVVVLIDFDDDKTEAMMNFTKLKS